MNNEQRGTGYEVPAYIIPEELARAFLADHNHFEALGEAKRALDSAEALPAETHRQRALKRQVLHDLLWLLEECADPKPDSEE